VAIKNIGKKINASPKKPSQNKRRTKKGEQKKENKKTNQKPARMSEAVR
jgi:hypothetical protein